MVFGYAYDEYLSFLFWVHKQYISLGFISIDYTISWIGDLAIIAGDSTDFVENSLAQNAFQMLSSQAIGLDF